MDLTYEHLWSAGYLLPATPVAKPEAPKPVLPRRGKKAARAKRGAKR